MRRPAPSSQATRLAALAVLTAAALLAGCTNAADHPKAPRTSATSASTSTAGPAPDSAADWSTTPRSIAAVGDSITRGFDACSVLKDCPEVSWVTGTDDRVDSFASRLNDEVPTDGRGSAGSGGPKSSGKTVAHTWNLARTGARMEDLSDQIGDAAKKHPELLVVLMGANDACRKTVAEMTSVADYRAAFEEALETARDKLPQSQILVASVPDLEQLWRVGRKNPLAKGVWRLGICPSMLSRPDSTSATDRARRSSVSVRIDEYNDVLEEVCASKPRCRFDGGAVHGYEFAMDELSPWDWFHPSVRGQASLAKLLYDVAFEQDNQD